MNWYSIISGILNMGKNKQDQNNSANKQTGNTLNLNKNGNSSSGWASMMER